MHRQKIPQIKKDPRTLISCQPAISINMTRINCQPWSTRKRSTCRSCRRRQLFSFDSLSTTTWRTIKQDRCLTYNATIERENKSRETRREWIPNINKSLKTEWL
jgi:ribosomal protein L20